MSQSLKLKDRSTVVVSTDVTSSVASARNSPLLAHISEWEEHEDSCPEDFFNYGKKILIHLAKHVAQLDSSITTNAQVTQRSLRDMEDKWRECAAKLTNGVEIGNFPSSDLLFNSRQMDSFEVTPKYRRKSTIVSDLLKTK